jgi:hypothetical protein
MLPFLPAMLSQPSLLVKLTEESTTVMVMVVAASGYRGKGKVCPAGCDTIVLYDLVRLTSLSRNNQRG